ncbi:MAG: phytoene/squalene synthase family protein [Gammaproteobacteria bacterium]|nr:phytoene/squalene synthase family protein [Gammaproteobacteria bacterium]
MSTEREPIRAVAARQATSADLAYQEHILQGVSRTFALTIPELPADLRCVVSNAYLLCRIADTIEDDPALDAHAKRRFSEAFIDVIAGELEAGRFVAELHPQLSGALLDSERDLVYNTARVIRITHGFRDRQRAALQRCVRIMSRGMADFQQNKSLHGLATLSHLDRYCYVVAGVVGEMLTELFCEHCKEMERHQDELMKLAVSFGQGLQMTNILKDVWEDRARGACWLPRDVFARAGFDVAALGENRGAEAFRAGLAELIGIARMHLQNALRYTLLIPARERGIRRFCLWALGMAVLTLRKIYGHLDYSEGQQVKISRSSVKATVLVTSASAGQDWLLKLLFELSTRGLPVSEQGPRGILV